MYCLKNKDWRLQGDFYSKVFSFMEIQLDKCRGSNCANKTEINNFFNNAFLNFAMINTYFDFQDYENPIKHYIDD